MFGLNFKGDFFHVWTDCTVAGVMDTRKSFHESCLTGMRK